MNIFFKSRVFNILIGFILAIIIFLFLAYKPYVGTGGTTSGTLAICCSSDGKIVYVADTNNVQKSEDAGKTWVTVISNK